MDPKQSITKNCETVWTYHLSPLLDPSEKPEEAQKNFLEKCTTQGAKECEDKGEDAKIMACLLNLAQKEAWAKFITPKSVRNVPAPAVEAPKDATPIDAPSLAPTIPQFVEPEALMLQSRWSGQFGVGFNNTSSGLSVNSVEPTIPYTIGSFFTGKFGRQITPVALSEKTGYTTFLGLQGDYAQFSPEKGASPNFSIWGVGPAVSALFVYQLTAGGSCLFFGPEAAFLLGALSTEGPIDVGIPEKRYQAKSQRMVGNALAGVTVGYESPIIKDALTLTLSLSSVGRYLIHGDQVTNTAAGYEGAMVRVKDGLMFDFIKLLVGVNY